MCAASKWPTITRSRILAHEFSRTSVSSSPSACAKPCSCAATKVAQSSKGTKPRMRVLDIKVLWTLSVGLRCGVSAPRLWHSTVNPELSTDFSFQQLRCRADALCNLSEAHVLVHRGFAHERVSLLLSHAALFH